MTILQHPLLRLPGAHIIWAFHDVSDADWFERCIDDIASSFEVMPLALLGRRPAYRRACAITFDDGLRSVLDVAHPILRERQFPYTVFVATDVLIGGPALWFSRVTHLVDHIGIDGVKVRWHLTNSGIRRKQDLITAMKKVPLASILEGLENLEEQYSITPPDPHSSFLSAAEVKSLSEAGATIGSHTHRHPILSLLTPQDQSFEIEESAGIIETLTGDRPIEFAYPNGSSRDFDQTTITLLRANGIRIAVTTRQRHITRRDDPLALPRVGLANRESTVRRTLKTLAPSLSRSEWRYTVLRRNRAERDTVVPPARPAAVQFDRIAGAE